MLCKQFIIVITNLFKTMGCN